jgi:hypothetical protein
MTINKICKLSDKELALLILKVLQERGVKEVTDVHIKSFVKIVKKYCEMFGERCSAESPCHHASGRLQSSFNEK